MIEPWNQEIDDESQEIRDAVGDLLAQLSQISEAPRGVEPAPRPFRGSEVDFSTNGWLDCLLAIQGWLRFEETLPPDASATTLVRQLTRLLGVGDDHGATALGSNLPDLSPTGLELLRARAERAVLLANTFVDDLQSDGGSLGSATRSWRDAWDESPEGEEDDIAFAGPVVAESLVLPINEFAQWADDGKLNLSPSYQRGDVWPTGDSQLLIESILRGIPLPSVIILQPKDMITSPYEVVDGKQRLTAILRFIGRHPEALRVVREASAKFPGEDLENLYRHDYPAFRRKWRNLTGETLTPAREREYYFPFRLRATSRALVGELAAFQGKYYTEVRRIPINIVDERVEALHVFERVSKYKLPVIQYSKATRRQIHEVFNLYNKQGKHLNAEEIRNALYHDLDFMRGILVMAGDSKSLDVAPFLERVCGDVQPLAGLLEEYGFGVARYRRSKVLAWILSLLVHEARSASGFRYRSTAGHIDSMLSRVEDDPHDPLRDITRLQDLATLVSAAVRAHAHAEEAWAPRFKDTDRGAKWQELQLVASLVGVTMAAAVVGDGVIDLLDEKADALRELSASPEWQRPTKTQTAEQWGYIARVSLGILDVLNVAPEDVRSRLQAKFGLSGVAALERLA